MDKELEYNEITAKEKPKRLKSLLVFKIVGTILYSIVTIPFVAFMITMLVDISKKDGLSLGIGKVVAIILFAIGAGVCLLVYLVPIILGIIGLVRTIKRQEKGKRAFNMVYFILMIAVPVVSSVLEFASIYLVKYIK